MTEESYDRSLLSHVLLPVADADDAETSARALESYGPERGLFSRLVGGSLVTDVAEDVDYSALLAERAHKRGITERHFGH